MEKVNVYKPKYKIIKVLEMLAVSLLLVMTGCKKSEIERYDIVDNSSIDLKIAFGSK